MNNFLKRTFSGFIFVAILISAILISSSLFYGVFLLITIGAVLEFRKLTNTIENVNVSVSSAAIGAVLLFCANFTAASGMSHFPLFPLYGLFVASMVIMELFRKQTNPLHNIAYFLMGQVLVALPFSLLNQILFINGYTPWILLSVFVTIWVNDTGAYLAGVTFGKHRLFERISPKKSWEGFFGGVVAACISGYIFAQFITEISVGIWILLSLCIVIAGTFGDLCESMLKRTINVKDSGNLIPGHGGLLDRFDSMLLAAPTFLILITILKYFNLVF